MSRSEAERTVIAKSAKSGKDDELVRLGEVHL